jgi:hypothetical protein
LNKVAAVVCGLAAAAYALGVALDSGALSWLGLLRELLVRQTWPLVCALAAIAAGCYALARRPAADLALAIAGTCLALFSGVVNAVVFGHAVAPVPWPGVLARVLVLLAVAGGLGIAAGAVLRLRSAGMPRPAPVDGDRVAV